MARYMSCVPPSYEDFESFDVRFFLNRISAFELDGTPSCLYWRLFINHIFFPAKYNFPCLNYNNKF